MRVQDGEGAFYQGEHLRACVFKAVCFFEEIYCFCDFLPVLRTLLQDAQQFIGVFCVLEMMNDHQCDFSLVDVLTIVALGLLELLSLKIQQIVLNLEGNS